LSTGEVELWTKMHNSLEHLYGRVRLSSQTTHTVVDDAVAFVLHCTTEEFFDFLELSFRAGCMWRILNDANDLVDATRFCNCRVRLTTCSKLSLRQAPEAKDKLQA
jgi:hypothetical protein